MRIALKHLRYAMEVLTPMYGKILVAEMAWVKKCHQLLGEIHDRDVWGATWKDYHSANQLSSSGPKAAAYLIQLIHRQRRRSYHRFKRQWHRWNRQRGWEEFLETVLSFSQS
jgi:CHAD domain-containing protein